MNKKKKNPSVPKLRFPKFRESGGVGDTNTL